MAGGGCRYSNFGLGLLVPDAELPSPRSFLDDRSASCSNEVILGGLLGGGRSWNRN